MQMQAPKGGEMSETHTIVIKFPEGQSPAYSAGTQILGGKVVAVDFSGDVFAERDRLAAENKRLREAIIDWRINVVLAEREGGK